jgi:hypothetical protein
MRILSHRGCWQDEREKNSLGALRTAFERGYGIETDIRDCCGKIVISHNPAGENCPGYADLAETRRRLAPNAVMALNVKADGLYLLLPELPPAVFLFDCSVPEQYVYLKRGYNVFTRSSEFEPQPAFWERSKGVWLDQFTDCGHIERVFERFLSDGRIVSVVSPELHGRDCRRLWKFLYRFREDEKFLLCTDKPDEAKEFFG